MEKYNHTTQIIIDNQQYKVFLYSKNIKKIIMKIDTLNNIYLHYPKQCSSDYALKHLNTHLDWLKKTINIQKERFKDMHIEECLGYKKIWILGNLYDIVEEDNKTTSYKVENNSLYIYGNKTKVLNKMALDVQCIIIDEFEKIAKSFSKHIKQKPMLVFKKMKSRWGSCNYNTGKITLNKKLIHTSSKLINFIIIHEFCHFIYPNHSKYFYQLLKEFLPDYLALEKELKKFSFYLTN